MRGERSKFKVILTITSIQLPVVGEEKKEYWNTLLIMTETREEAAFLCACCSCPSQPSNDLELFLFRKNLLSQDQKRDTEAHSLVKYRNRTDGNFFHLIGFTGSEGGRKSNLKEVNLGGYQFHG